MISQQLISTSHIYQDANALFNVRMDNKQIRRDNLRALVGTGKIVTVANIVETDPAYLSQILSAKTQRDMGDMLARKFEEKFNKPYGWMDQAHSYNDPCNMIAETPVPYQVRRIDDDEGNIAIPRFDVQASMGIGAVQPDTEMVIGKMVLSEQWLRSAVSFSNVNNLAIISAIGDSMSPTFAGGDILLVDRGIAEIKLDAVFVLAINQELYIKRIQRRMDGAIIIKSDNQLYDPQIIENGHREGLQVLGRVLWAWNGRKL